MLNGAYSFAVIQLIGARDGRSRVNGPYFTRTIINHCTVRIDDALATMECRYRTCIWARTPSSSITVRMLIPTMKYHRDVARLALS